MSVWQALDVRFLVIEHDQSTVITIEPGQPQGCLRDWYLTAVRITCVFDAAGSSDAPVISAIAYKIVGHLVFSFSFCQT